MRDLGLVVLTGCGHGGAVNIVRHAQALTGETRVHGVIGGLHLSGPAFEAQIPPTVDALVEPPRAVDGRPRALHGSPPVRFAMMLPDAFVPNSVGTSFVLAAA